MRVTGRTALQKVRDPRWASVLTCLSLLLWGLLILLTESSGEVRKMARAPGLT